jgi:hypothetical protein
VWRQLWPRGLLAGGLHSPAGLPRPRPLTCSPGKQDTRPNLYMYLPSHKPLVIPTFSPTNLTSFWPRAAAVRPLALTLLTPIRSNLLFSDK